MKEFHIVKDLVKPGDWLAKLDMKDTYFLVSVDPSHQKFLQFQWQGNLYQFHCLPFDLFIYLDDLLILCSCWNTLLIQLQLIKNLFQMLGFLINRKKSQLEAIWPLSGIKVNQEDF